MEAIRNIIPFHSIHFLRILIEFKLYNFNKCIVI